MLTHCRGTGGLRAASRLPADVPPTHVEVCEAVLIVQPLLLSAKNHQGVFCEVESTVGAQKLPPVRDELVLEARHGSLSQIPAGAEFLRFRPAPPPLQVQHVRCECAALLLARYTTVPYRPLTIPVLLRRPSDLLLLCCAAGMGPRSSAGAAVLVQSCCMTAGGALLVLVPDASDLLLAPSATRSAVHVVRDLAQVVGGLLILVAALLCSIPEPPPSTCRSVAAGSGVAAALCVRAAVSPLLRPTTIGGLAVFFALAAVTLLVLAPLPAVAGGQTAAPGPGGPSEAAPSGKVAVKPGSSHSRTKPRSE